MTVDIDYIFSLSISHRFAKHHLDSEFALVMRVAPPDLESKRCVHDTTEFYLEWCTTNFTLYRPHHLNDAPNDWRRANIEPAGTNPP